MTLSAYVRKAERSEINKISFYSKKLEKEEQITSKWNQRKKIAQVSTEIDKTENRKKSKPNAGSPRSIKLIYL